MKQTSLYLAAFLFCGAVPCYCHAAAAPAPASAPAKPAPKMSDLFPDGIIAKGKGVEVKRSQLDDAMVSIKSSFAARGQDLPPDEMSRLEQQILDRLIQIQILLLRATDSDKAAG